MGIIRNLKALYPKNMVTRLISRIDSGSSVAVSQLAKFAMHMLKTAGQNVKQVSIVNCFAKAGFVPETPPMEEDVDDPPPGMTA